MLPKLSLRVLRVTTVNSPKCFCDEPCVWSGVRNVARNGEVPDRRGAGRGGDHTSDGRAWPGHGGRDTRGHVRLVAHAHPLRSRTRGKTAVSDADSSRHQASRVVAAEWVGAAFGTHATRRQPRQHWMLHPTPRVRDQPPTQLCCVPFIAFVRSRMRGLGVGTCPREGYPGR